MAKYYYTAKDKNGGKIEGELDAVSAEAVALVLGEKGLLILDISEEKQAASRLNFMKIFNRVKGKDLVVFFRQFSVMVEANLPVVKSLRTLMRQTKNERLKGIISALADEVEGGSTLSAAMEMHPDVFGKFFVNIVRSGETSGRLSEVMTYLADQKEKDYELESKVRGAMIYPAFIIAVLIVVGFVVFTFVVPKMTAMLTEAGAKLPFITQVLLDTSAVFQKYWYLMIIGAFLLITGFQFLIRTPYGRAKLDLLKIKIPVFGVILRDIYIVRMCRSFATLLRGGVTVAQSLEVVKDVVDNKVYEKLIEDTIASINEGNPVSESFSNSPYMPLMVSQMTAIGEDTGKLDEVLERVSEFYGREIDNYVRNLSSLIEPIIMIVLGVAVAFFVAAIILPMWQLSANFGEGGG